MKIIMDKKLTGLTILLIDDEKDNLIVISKTLIFFGATVYTAENGFDALEKIETIPLPNLILSDISMPKMDGWTFLPLIKEKYPSMTVVAVTAHAMTGDKERVLAAGFNSYISKPINVMELASKILTIMDQVPHLT